MAASTEIGRRGRVVQIAIEETGLSESTGTEQKSEGQSNVKSLVARIATWLVTIGCFYLVYSRVGVAAGREGLTTTEYIVNFFAEANWIAWLAIMIPYSVFFFLVDSHATWRVIRWFNAPEIKYTNILPIRASAYILSLVNEQVGKGAMSLYLLKKYKVPVWQAVSTMVMLGMVEIYQLLLFSAVGVAVYYDLVVSASTSYPLPKIMLTVYGVAFAYFPIHLLYFSGKLLKNSKLRDRHIFHTLKQARLKHYAMLLLFKAPNMLGAMVVYTLALGLFQVDVAFGQMVAFLPVIFLAAALPLPFHAGALVLWTVLFPDFPEVGVFSLIMHTFFVVFNAVIGLVFLPKANKELFIDGSVAKE